MNARHQDVIPAQAAPLAVQAEQPNLLLAIQRAATDPATDVVKMKELLAMAKEIRLEDARMSFNQAMASAQKAMRRVAADSKNPQTHSNYASYAALDRALRPIYTEHGFALSFGTGDAPSADMVRVTCHVSHEDGFTRDYHIDMPADGKGAKGGDVMTKTHATGSAITYGTRYLLKMIFNVAVGDDDDGNAAGTPLPRVSAEQASNLQALLEEVGADKAKFLKWAKAESLESIPAQAYSDCVAMIERKRGH